MTVTPESDGKYLSSAGLITLAIYESEIDRNSQPSGDPREEHTALGHGMTKRLRAATRRS